MNLVDVNIVLYAYDEAAAHHEPARRFWEELLSDADPVGLAWVTVLAFLRIGTNARAYTEPMTIDEACAHVSSWMDRPNLRLVQPTSRHWDVVRDLLVTAQAPANLVPDAHLAALAIEHGATLCSTDRDFARFDGLRWRDPLQRGG